MAKKPDERTSGSFQSPSDAKKEDTGGSGKQYIGEKTDPEKLDDDALKASVSLLENAEPPKSEKKYDGGEASQKAQEEKKKHSSDRKDSYRVLTKNCTINRQYHSEPDGQGGYGTVDLTEHDAKLLMSRDIRLSKIV